MRDEGLNERPALRSFQKAGIIVYRRGSIKILKRKELEGLSCECYQIIKNEYERLLNVDW
jgi:hypothetical protein